MHFPYFMSCLSLFTFLMAVLLVNEGVGGLNSFFASIIHNKEVFFSHSV